MNVQSSKPQGSFFVRGTIALLALILIPAEWSEDKIMIWNMIMVTDTILEDFIRLPSKIDNTALTYEWRMNLVDLETLFYYLIINKHIAF